MGWRTRVRNQRNDIEWTICFVSRQMNRASEWLWALASVSQHLRYIGTCTWYADFNDRTILTWTLFKHRYNSVYRKLSKRRYCEGVSRYGPSVAQIMFDAISYFDNLYTFSSFWWECVRIFTVFTAMAVVRTAGTADGAGYANLVGEIEEQLAVLLSI